MHHSPAASAGNKEYLARFHGKVVQMRLPLTGSLEITARCNLACVHCYLGPQGRDRIHGREELSTRRIMSVIDEFTGAGCLYLLLTGGEPFSRKDFPEIYTHAKTNGLLVSVFTNGTMITESIAELFADLPPQAVEISLYGATSGTYEKITGVKGSFAKCLSGIERLLEKNIEVQLKTVLMSLNQHEFFAIKSIATNYGVKFRFDAAIFPGFNGDKTPLALRARPRDVAEKEFSDPGQFQRWKEYFERTQNNATSDALYHCGAGTSSFHVDAYGILSPCLMMTRPKYDLGRGNFSAGWDHLNNVVREQRMAADFACRACRKKALCGYCPAFFELENGAEQLHSDYLCSLGENRFRQLVSKGILDDKS